MNIKKHLYRLLFYPLLCAGLIFAAAVVHYSSSDATWLSRQLYFFDAWRARHNQLCTGPAAEQLRPLLQYASRHAGSLTSQLALRDAKGQVTLCSSAAYGQTPDANKRFRYASLTKLLTAQAVLDAMQDAELPLNTPLSQFVPEAETATDTRWQQVTVGQLLTHSAGLDRLSSPDPMTIHGGAPWCPHHLERLQNTRLDFDPGTRHAYSNLTYCLLGVVLEKLDGTNVRKAMQQRLQLARHDIRFIDGPYLPDEVAYDFRHAGFYAEDYYRYLDLPALSAAAGLSGSAAALMRLLADLYDSGRLTALPTQLPEGCNPARKRTCYGPALFPYRKAADSPLLWVQQGYLFGVSSLAVLATDGSMLVWLGNGKPARGTGADTMLDAVYEHWEQLHAASRH